MKKKLLIPGAFIIATGLVLIYSKQEKNIPQTPETKESVIAGSPEQPETKKDPEYQKISTEEFTKKYPLNDKESNFLKNFVQSDSDLVIAEAILLGRHDPQSPMVQDLKKVVLLNPKLSIQSMVKFISQDELQGFELEKSALISFGKDLAIDHDSKLALVNAATSELFKVVRQLPDSSPIHSNQMGPEVEMNYIKTLSKDDANKLTSVLSYFKIASEGTEGIVKHQDVVKLLKDIPDPVVKNILGRNYLESSKDKLSTEELANLRDAGINFDSYSKNISE